MGPTAGRRLGALIAMATLLASLTAVTVSSAASAAKPRCDGKVATIVSWKRVIRGTNRADVIVALGNKDNRIYGKGGRDRICAGRGNDIVTGGRGNDRLFGGSGKDSLDGQAGRDDLFGYSGDDLLFGGAQADYLDGGVGRDYLDGRSGPDILKGGAGDDLIFGEFGDDKLYGQVGDDDLDGNEGTDLCVQGPGTGEIRNCEATVADFEVKIFGPGSPTVAGDITFEVQVRNYGPDPDAYQMTVWADDSDADCDIPFQDDVEQFGSLAPGGMRSGEYTVTCSVAGASPRVQMNAVVDAYGDDPVPENNAADLNVYFE